MDGVAGAPMGVNGDFGQSTKGDPMNYEHVFLQNGCTIRNHSSPDMRLSIQWLRNLIFYNVCNMHLIAQTCRMHQNSERKRNVSPHVRARRVILPSTTPHCSFTTALDGLGLRAAVTVRDHFSRCSEQRTGHNYSRQCRLGSH